MDESFAIYEAPDAKAEKGGKFTHSVNYKYGNKKNLNCHVQLYAGSNALMKDMWTKLATTKVKGHSITNAAT